MMFLFLQIGIMCPQIILLLDIYCNPSCPIILGRPFLRTIGAVIDMKEGNIKFQFPLRKDMGHFPRTRIRQPYESIMRASYGSRTKDDNTQIYALCLARGVNRQRLLGGKPIFIFLPFGFLVVLQKYIKIPLIRYVFMFNQCLCQAKPLGSCWVIVDLILLKNRNFCAQKKNSHF